MMDLAEVPLAVDVCIGSNWMKRIKGVVSSIQAYFAGRWKSGRRAKAEVTLERLG